jgi:hypothetical protein
MPDTCGSWNTQGSAGPPYTGSSRRRARGRQRGPDQVDAPPGGPGHDRPAAGDDVLLAREQRQRVLDAPLEHLIGESPVGERSGQLQSADQQREQAERLSTRRLRITGSQD